METCLGNRIHRLEQTLQCLSPTAVASVDGVEPPTKRLRSGSGLLDYSRHFEDDAEMMTPRDLAFDPRVVAIGDSLSRC
ncbi:hypothetical protein Plhal304r1_c063g0150871 [Plasmopara halstedii]